jgi:hypothetical protein
MSTKNFNCTQQELYSVCALGWESCSQHLEKFTSLKPKYSPAFIQARRDEIEAIRKMPDRYRRAASQELLRLELKKQAGSCLDAWRNLQSHIREAWTTVEQQNSCMKSAGLAYYRDAYKMKWEACQSLMISAVEFIRENSAQLLANENMNAGFPDIFSALAKGFNDSYAKYFDSVKKAELDTEAKRKANVKLRKDLMSMFADAKMIFKNEPAMLKMFTFESVLLQVSGPGTAGIKGLISNGAVPVGSIPGLELILAETGEEAAIDEDGTYRFSQMAAGTYTLKVTAPGYKEQSIPNVVVNTGTYTVLNLELEALEKI